MKHVLACQRSELVNPAHQFIQFADWGQRHLLACSRCWIRCEHNAILFQPQRSDGCGSNVDSTRSRLIFHINHTCNPFLILAVLMFVHNECMLGGQQGQSRSSVESAWCWVRRWQRSSVDDLSPGSSLDGCGKRRKCCGGAQIGWAGRSRCEFKILCKLHTYGHRIFDEYVVGFNWSVVCASLSTE